QTRSTFLLKKNCTTSSRNLRVIPIALKKFMKIKNRSRYRGPMSACQIRRCWLHKNFSMIRYISEKEKMICSVDTYKMRAKIILASQCWDVFRFIEKLRVVK